MSDYEDDEDINTCPLCEEEMDLSDKNFLPCPCGYRVCMWCWHHIRENLNGLCPACRTPYNADPHAFSAVDRTEIVKKNRERKLKEKEKKDVKPVGLPAKNTVVDRKHLHNYRVVQRNLVYVIGLPLSITNEDMLRKPEYFGQYGKIVKVVLHRNQTTATHTTLSAYVTFAYKEDAKASIQALDNYWIEGHPLRASFGTTKYCNNFIRNVPCNNPECVYLHELGDEDDRFTKEEIQAGHTKLIPTPGKDQIVVTGCGGPSGTGKKPAGEPILPAPVFLQDAPKSTSKDNSTPETADGKEVINSPNPSAMIPPALEAAPKIPDLDGKKSRETPKKDQSSTPIINQLNPPSETIIDTAKELENKIPSESIYSSTSQSEPINIISYQESINQHKLYISNPYFNGITLNAVFPVPKSTFYISIWSTVVKASYPSLTSNPYNPAILSISDILDLTLPPVDVASIPLPKSSKDSIPDMSTLNLNDNTEDSLKSNRDAVNESSLKSDTAPLNGFNALQKILPGVNVSYSGLQK